MALDTINVAISMASGSSMLGCLVLLGIFYRINQKPTSLKMIMILTLSDLVTSILVLIMAVAYGVATDNSSILLFAGLANSLCFSIIWSCNIAYFVYKSINGSIPSDPGQYLKKSLIICIVLILGMDIMTSILDQYRDIAMNMGIESVVILLILLFLVLSTSYYYVRAIKVLNQYPIQFQQAVRPAVRNLYFYAFGQFITIGPYLVLQAIRYKGQVRDNWFLAFSFIANLTGLVNVLIYLFTSRGCYIEFADSNEMKANLIERDDSLIV